jgi:hypothetical protein
MQINHTPRRNSTSSPIYVVGPSIAYVELTKGLYALVDREDADALCQWNWKASSNGYATRLQNVGDSKQITISMHRVLCWSLEFVDHVNRNTMDNRKSNLRAATMAQNARNRKTCSMYGLKGIHPNGNKWVSRIRVNGISIYLGNFDTPEQANAAYVSAAEAHYGQFARG